MKNPVIYLFLVLLLARCEKSVSFDLNNSVPGLVVEAVIENNQPPLVILSTSLDYFSRITPELLLNSFVHDAEVSISNGVQSQRLKEYSYKTTANISIYYYSIDSSNLSNVFVGEFNHDYSLEVKVNGKAYHSKTSIPALTKKLDSLWWVKSVNNPDTNKVVLMTKVTDPPGYGNYIRFFTKVDNGPFLPGINSVFDDQIINGSTYEIEVEKGIDRNEKINLDDYSFFQKGDTVTVKFCNIDKATFDFWRTMEYSYASIGNPFSTPTKVLGNIQGGALGYFGGYAVQYISLIIPR
ncbi:MAG: DUF4249 domain-containing protein [Chitinophagaceae bacterium]